ncbi:MAG: division plane positioning ATPase MipZ [Lacunisphaera sp.]|nr:division plane positioning ATPase MipZ [Lacunisphaera sp.]
MKKLILFPQDKGGIGKSFVATLLYDYLCDQGVTLKAFDLDHANSTFNRFVPEAEFIDTDVDVGKLAVLDRLLLALEVADVVLADNRASGGEKILHYLDEVRLPELQTELGCALVFLVVANDDKDAISQIADLVDRYEDKVRWVVARNLRDGTLLRLFGQSNTRRRLLDLGAVEVDVPCLAEVTRNRLQLADLTVGRGRSAEQLHLLDRSRCARYHHQMAAEFRKANEVLLP